MTIIHQKDIELPFRKSPKRNTQRYIIVKTLNIQREEKILKAARENTQVIYKEQLIIFTPNFSLETVKVRRAWKETL